MGARCSLYPDLSRSGSVARAGRFVTAKQSLLQDCQWGMRHGLMSGVSYLALPLVWLFSMNMIAVDHSCNGLQVSYNALSCTGTVGIDLPNAADKTLQARQLLSEARVVQ